MGSDDGFDEDPIHIADVSSLQSLLDIHPMQWCILHITARHSVMHHTGRTKHGSRTTNAPQLQ